MCIQTCKQWPMLASEFLGTNYSSTYII
uniref:Uncharacterized protein n=1 Tax=Arundo donax TaxID=35708 RepID=A0A0A9GP13_ARUDO